MCCGKVNVIYKGKNIKGYVLDETKTDFIIRLVNNMQINAKKPMIITRTGPSGKINMCFYEYEVQSDATYEKYVITELMPMRFKYQKNALDNMQLIVNKMVLDVNGKIVEQLCS